VDDLGSAMRLMGRNPSKQNLNMLVDLVDSNGNHQLHFQDFLRMMVSASIVWPSLPFVGVNIRRPTDH
jgi:Ca2+-binding EF-hand superfamily protein